MLILGHRGFCTGPYAENTIPSFLMAIQLGADGIECDLRVSRDGELVSVHDRNLRRIAGVKLRVQDASLQDLQLLTLRRGGSIASLNEITKNIPAPSVIDFEIKDRDATEPLIRKLKTSSALRARSFVSSFHAATLLRVREELPDLRTILLCRTWPLPLRTRVFWKRVGRLAPWGLGFPVGFRSSVLSRRRIHLIQEKGYRVVAWDVRSSRRNALRVLSLDVDVAIIRQSGN